MTKLHIAKAHHAAMLPARATALAAGMDVRAHLWRDVTVYTAGNSGVSVKPYAGTLCLNPGDRALVPTGLRMRPEAGYCIKLYPRSGLSIKRGLTLINAVGVGDEDYQLEYCIPLWNTSTTPQSVADGERLCQLMIEQVEPVEVIECDELPVVQSDRRGGFGSTGHE